MVKTVHSLQGSYHQSMSCYNANTNTQAFHRTVSGKFYVNNSLMKL